MLWLLEGVVVGGGFVAVDGMFCDVGGEFVVVKGRCLEVLICGSPASIWRV